MWYAPLVFRIPLWGFPECKRPGFDPWVRKIPWRRKWHPTPVRLPGKISWMKDPGGLYSPWGHRVKHDQVTSLHFTWGLSDFIVFSTLKKKFFPRVLKRACFIFKIRRKIPARRRNVILMQHLFRLLTSGFTFFFYL